MTSNTLIPIIISRKKLYYLFLVSPNALPLDITNHIVAILNPSTGFAPNPFQLSDIISVILLEYKLLTLPQSSLTPYLFDSIPRIRAFASSLLLNNTPLHPQCIVEH